MATYCTEQIRSIPDYINFQEPKVAVGKTGALPGEFNVPRGLKTEPKSGNLFVADSENSRVQIFSQEGEYLNKFGEQFLKNPWGILFLQDCVYVTDTGHDAVLQFKLKDFTLVKKVGEKGNNENQFDGPRQPAVSPNQLIYVPDEYNERIQILTPKLEFQGELRNNDLSSPADIIFHNNEMFVLSCDDLRCIYVFDLQGEFLRSFVTMGEQMQVTMGMFFCMDPQNNFIIADWLQDDVKVISPEGTLLHRLGSYGYKAGTFSYPTGVIVQDETKLVCVSENRNFGLQVFFAN